MNNVFKFALREDLVGREEFLPTRKHSTDTGWDVSCAKETRISALEKVAIPLGFRAFCPEGWWFELKPRSSAFGKKSLHALYGTIDETYEGELIFACRYIPAVANIPDERGFDSFESWEDYCSKSISIEFGERIGQIIPVQRQSIVVESVSNEEFDKLCAERNAARGAGGFGSTGDK